MNHEEFKAKLFQREGVRKEYEKLKLEEQIKNAVITERTNQKLTQKELAERVGTNQSSISRFENGNYLPSIEFLQKIARGLGKEIKIDLV